MSRPSAKVIAHSEAPNGEQLITLEIELHRFVLPEFNTHRSISRNFQSSRALPVSKMIEQVRSNPAMPVHWGKNQAGMVADKELVGDELIAVKQGWLSAAKEAARYAEALSELGCHKQTVNRLLEPFMWTKGIVTATKDAFEAFFKLRCHKDAQPEIKLLAERMRDAINASVSVKLKVGDYHLPYIECYKPLGSGKQVFPVGNGTSEVYSLENAVKISTSCSAQVSYRRLDTSLEKALKIYDMLNLPINGEFSDEPPHCYDDQTEVLTEKGFIKWEELNGEKLVTVNPSTGEFNGLCENYQLIKHHIDDYLYHYNGSKIDLMITKGHKLYGSLINKYSGRKTENFQLFSFDEKTPPKYRVDYQGLRPMKMKKSCNPKISEMKISNSEYNLFKLVGFFIGDGHLPSDGSVNLVRFNLRKTRKIKYLKDICENINGCSLKQYKNGNFTITIKGAKDYFSNFIKDGKKTLPVSWGLNKPQELIDAIFDGLKNSGGSIKRKGWVYSTSSEQLKDDLLSISPVFGYNATISRVNVHDNPNHNTNYVINFSNSRTLLVNDSRSDQTVEKVKYTGFVYCADTGGNVLIVRRKGKVVLSGNCSPTEHQAKVVDVTDGYMSSGNFHSKVFWQYRKALESGTENKFLTR